MKTKGDSLITIIAWLVGGFVLSIVALFTIMGGYIFGILLMVAFPFIAGFLALEAMFGKRPVYVTSVGTEDISAEHQEEFPALHISARVVSAEGICPVGRSFRVGDLWTINGVLQGSEGLCPSAEQLLRNTAARLREGQTHIEEVRCVGPEHRVIFAIQSELEQVSMRDDRAEQVRDAA